VAAVSGLAIGFASPAERPETTRLVLTAVLPLLGTWVGAVLAYYFARENMRTATESTLRLAAQATKGAEGTPVWQVMIPMAQIHAYDLGADEDAGNVTLRELHRRMRSDKRQRIPILTASGAVRYVVHESTIAGFAASLSKDPGDEQQFTETMADLLQDDMSRKAIGALGFVGPDADVNDARVAMRSVELCNDVFVTTGGKKDDPVVGWLTNTDLAGSEGGR
jgi:hypothetical protein